MKYLIPLALATSLFTTACTTETVALVKDGTSQSITQASYTYDGLGKVIAHSPASKRVFIGSPAILVLPSRMLLASNDFFGPSSDARVGGKPFTRIYKSLNDGDTWSVQSDVIGQVSSNLFLHRNKLYLLGASEAGGDLIIRESIDRGKTWTTPNPDPIIEGTGFLSAGNYHTAPTPVIRHNKRLWRAIENQDGAIQIWPKLFQPMMMSASVDANLLDAKSWTLSNAMPFDSTYLWGYFGGWLEGNAVVGPDQKMLNILRVHTYDKVNERAAIVNISDDGKTATFDSKSGFVNFPGGGKKFTVRYDSLSKRYWTLSNHVPEKDQKITSLNNVRNTLALCSSANLVNWTVESVILEHPDRDYHGFQYADWQFDGNDIVSVVRTAYDDGLGGAENYHNSNFMTFHRVENFRGQYILPAAPR